MSLPASALPAEIRKKKSYLCLGLDPDPNKLPVSIPKTPEGILQFCLSVLETTVPFVVAAKVNTAFFESLGAKGWIIMGRLFEELNRQNLFVIADAKRADIGNTSEQYAKAFFDHLNADAITLSPYMGHDSIAPFLTRENKTAILLALTSNPGHADFEMQELKNGKRLFEQVLETAQTWPRRGDLMFVVGATRAAELEIVRAICPNHFLLVPGVGAQGGSLEVVSKMGMNQDVGLLVNASRSILYASVGEDFAESARGEAQRMQMEMAGFI